jgi:hypothetical protein
MQSLHVWCIICVYRNVLSTLISVNRRRILGINFSVFDIIELSIPTMKVAFATMHFTLLYILLNNFGIFLIASLYLYLSYLCLFTEVRFSIRVEIYTFIFQLWKTLYFQLSPTKDFPYIRCFLLP